MFEYNLITTKNSVKPNYDISNKDFYFEIYVSPGEEVCLLGKIDTNYICWCSITKVTQLNTNEEIINYLLSQSTERLYSSHFQVLGSRYEEIRKWHSFIVTKHWHKDHYWYRSPVSNCFFGTPPYNNGSFLAREIQKFFLMELSKCQYRLIDNVYVKVLSRYKDILMKENSPEYYHEMLPIKEIINSESYLKLCSNDEIRILYLECFDQCTNLYNLYMTASR